VWFWATGYEDPNGQLASLNGCYEESENVLLVFVIGTLIQTIQDDHRHECEAGYCLEWLYQKALELNGNRTTDDQLIAFDGLLHWDEESWYSIRELICDGGD
jgi:hypothetical protein